ncbi:hypothetical protein [Stenotrophomonas acidaminiphila]|uniref:hypothetical protein n=1 Tax=Stenotrophomonas acidaminiphila TaxID=128780 RepID=UPI0020C5CEF7|nr:hypothetical protein [Stenotrophomonas acidaminiphila]
MKHQLTGCLLLVAVSAITAPAKAADRYEDDSAARAVLECHARYAQTYATIRPIFQASDIAIGAKAHCIEQMREFERHVREDASGSGKAVWMMPAVADRYLGGFHDYVYAYTVDQYVKAVAAATAH